MKLPTRKTLPILVGLCLATPALAATDYGEIRRDVEVLSRALQAADGDNGGPSLSRIEGSYLAGQGVVLHLSAHRLGSRGGFSSFHGGDLEAFGEGIEVFVDDVLSGVEISMQAVDEALSGLDLDEINRHGVVVLDDSDVAVMRKEIRREMGGDRGMKDEEMRELRKEQASARRAYAQAQREYERSLEAYEDKLESGGDKAEAHSAYERAEEAMAAARESYRKGRSAYQDKVEAMREEKQKQRQVDIETFATATLENFCRYGTSLRSLPDDEHISLVFEGMGSEESGKDLIYVIQKKDHRACLAGDIESTALAQRAVSYAF